MKGIGSLAALTVLAVATSASAQDVASVGALAPAPDQMRVRFQIAAMEGVLERAVQLGARRLSQQVEAVSPDSLFIAGSARAKGFALDGYGVFFDVEVPAMRRSVAWSFRQLGRPDGNVETAMAVLRRGMTSVTDPVARRQMEDAMQRLARSVGPTPMQAQAHLRRAARCSPCRLPARRRPCWRPARRPRHPDRPPSSSTTRAWRTPTK